MISPLRTWMSRTVWLPYLGAALVFGGCAATSKTDVLESRLRHQEDMISRYQAQLDRAKTELDIARRESASLRTQLAESNQGVRNTSRESLDASLQANSVIFSPLMTGGADLDGQPGDDGLSIVLAPQDIDGEIVKVPGTIEIEAFDLSRPGGATRIGHWTFDQEECLRFWHRGVIQSGYQFELPWQELPEADKLLLHGRLTALDGRQFDTTHTVRIEPPDPSVMADKAPSTRDPHVKQAAGEKLDVSPSTGNDASKPAERKSSTPAFGHGGVFGASPRGSAQSLTSGEFLNRLNVSQPLSVGAPSAKAGTVPRGEGQLPWGNSIDARPQEDPPTVDAAPNDETWYLETQRPVRTSDSWTSDTLPYLR